ncbi:MAG: serine acetyltransferase [Gemmataceae bacterium]|nr:serine acetyltransferase [Gemmataceae bacterium]
MSGAEVSATEPDWGRERPARFWDPGRRLLRTIRGYQRCRPGPFGSVARWWWVLRHRFWSAVSGADIPLNARLGGGLLLPHPNGVVIHPAAVIGPNCLIFQQVTIGTGPRPGVPTIGGHVDIGAGAKVLGGVTVGDHARIGANAVVTADVPAGATVATPPAVVVALRPVADLEVRPA